MAQSEILPHAPRVRPLCRARFDEVGNCQIDALAALRTKKKGGDARTHLAVDARGMPAGFIAAGGAEAGCRSAYALVDGFETGSLLADGAHGTDEALAKAAGLGAEPSSRRS